MEAAKRASITADIPCRRPAKLIEVEITHTMELQETSCGCELMPDTLLLCEESDLPVALYPHGVMGGKMKKECRCWN